MFLSVPAEETNIHIEQFHTLQKTVTHINSYLTSSNKTCMHKTNCITQLKGFLMLSSFPTVDQHTCVNSNNNNNNNNMFNCKWAVAQWQWL